MLNCKLVLIHWTLDISTVWPLINNVSFNMADFQLSPSHELITRLLQASFQKQCHSLVCISWIYDILFWPKIHSKQNPLLSWNTTSSFSLQTLNITLLRRGHKKTQLPLTLKPHWSLVDFFTQDSTNCHSCHSPDDDFLLGAVSSSPSSLLWFSRSCSSCWFLLRWLECTCCQLSRFSWQPSSSGCRRWFILANAWDTHYTHYSQHKGEWEDPAADVCTLVLAENILLLPGIRYWCSSFCDSQIFQAS